MMSLLEYAKKGKGTPIERAVIETYVDEASFLAETPIQTIDGNAIRYDVEEALPGIGFRGVNEDFEESHGVINQQVENLSIAGGNLDVDKFKVETEGPRGRASHTLMKVKALAHQIAYTAIKGSSAIDQREFDGLQVRIPVDGPQSMDAGNTVDGDPLSLFDLDALIDLVDNPTAIWTTKAMRTRFGQAARNPSVAGNVEWKRNEFGKRVLFYGDLPIRVCDENGLNRSVLSFNEGAPGGGTGLTTSLYVVSEGESALHLIQSKPPEVLDLGLLENARTFRTNVNWNVGMCIKHPRAVARLRGIKNVPFIA